MIIKEEFADIAKSAASVSALPTRLPKVGIEKTALIRVRAGISFALAEAMNDGHCGLPERAHTHPMEVLGVAPHETSSAAVC